jgi:peptide-methionine (S)-S-oxide reductase
VRTRVGYAGGTKPSPTYRDLGDHTEALQVDFDPARITFAQLLEVFWQEHDPCGRAWSTQYKAILFHDGEAQRRAAAASAEQIARERGRKVTTELVAHARFWPAEDYHQKYALRHEHPLYENVRALLPSEAEFRDAELTAKLNAFAAGDLTRAWLDAALAGIGYVAIGEGGVTGVRRQ